MAKELQVVSTDAINDDVVINLRDETGTAFTVALKTIDVASLVGMLRASLEEAGKHPQSGGWALPGIHHVQYYKNGGTEYFRVYLSERLFHEYTVQPNTVLALELKEFADRVEARALRKATPPAGTH